MREGLLAIILLLHACVSREPTKALVMIENRSGDILSGVQVKAYGGGVSITSMADQASLVYEVKTGPDGEIILQFQMHGKSYIEKGAYITGGVNTQSSMRIGPDGVVDQTSASNIP